MPNFCSLPVMRDDKAGISGNSHLFLSRSHRSSRRKEALTERGPLQHRNAEPPYVGCYGGNEIFKRVAGTEAFLKRFSLLPPISLPHLTPL
jgi:hypothetical protein